MSNPLLVLCQPDYWPYLQAAAREAHERDIDEFVSKQLGLPARVYVVDHREPRGRRVRRAGRGERLPKRGAKR